MHAFALVIVLSIAPAGQPVDAQAYIIDHGLTRHDCARLARLYKPMRQALPNGVTIETAPACRIEAAEIAGAIAA